MLLQRPIFCRRGPCRLHVFEGINHFGSSSPGGFAGKEWLMRKLFVSTAVILLACSMAQAEIYNYHFFLDGPQAGVVTPGTGEGHVTYNSVSNQIQWNVTYKDLLGTVNNAHFHGPALPGENTGVQINHQGLANPQTGTATLTEVQEGQLLSGRWYWNIHTSFNGNGEIRGQVVPEPATLGLLSIGALGLLARRRRA
jgi:hypothetical protein